MLFFRSLVFGVGVFVAGVKQEEEGQHGLCLVSFLFRGRRNPEASGASLMEGEEEEEKDEKMAVAV